MSDAFERVVYHDRLMDKKGKAFIQACEEKLGYELTITQGNYNPGGVAASAGTHDGGGVFDLPSWDHQHKLKVIKDLGGWGWLRRAIPGLWGEHIHFGITNHGTLSAGARSQQVAYFARRNGLKSNLRDNSYRAEPVPIFKYPVKPKPPPPTNVSMARDDLVQALHELNDAEAKLSNAPKSRKAVWAQIEEFQQAQKKLRRILEALPKR